MDLRTLFLVLITFSSSAQVIPDHRKVDWSLAGNTVQLTTPPLQVNILDFGGVNDLSATNDQAILNAIAQLNGSYGAIYFPEGAYLFEETVQLPDSTWLVGESSNSILKFDVPDGNAIQMAGGQSADTLWLTEQAYKGEFSISVNDVSGLSIGDVIRIGMDDDDLVFSEWARGFFGQTIRVVDTLGNQVLLEDPLHLDLDPERNPFAVRIEPRVQAGLECLTVERIDTVNDGNINISIQRAHNCAVRNVTGFNADFAHVAISASAHCEVSGCYFKDAIAYAGGGQGYGAVVQYASSLNLIQNNIFEHLRHSMMAQAGSGGNVFGYNYSLDPFWEEQGFPADAAGDIVLHGNYPYLNLFEGNVASNIVVDASHDINGPFNTFFRNRATLYGIVMDDQIPSDSMNWIGNEVTLTGFPFGNFALFGAGQLTHGNNVSGTITPLGTGLVEDTSLYLIDPLDIFNGLWPLIGFPATLSENDLPAQTNHGSGQFTSCTDPVITGHMKDYWAGGIVISGRMIRYVGEDIPEKIRVFNVDGRLIQESDNTRQLLLPEGQIGFFIVQIELKNGTTLSQKFVLTD